MKPFTLPRSRFTNCCGHNWGHPVKPRATETPSEGTGRRGFLKAAATGVAGRPRRRSASSRRRRPP